MKKLKVVFFGLGSIGTRLARLTKDNFHYDIFAFRTGQNSINNLNIEEIYNLDELKKISPDVAFITNPTSLHLKTAIYAASLQMHLFIEKPLSHNLDNYSNLLSIIKKNNIITCLGCELRFDPITEYLKKNLDIKQFFYSKAICSSYLPDWRPQMDYKKSYSAKKYLGGGVLLDLIHEPDYCSWLFGPIEKIEGHLGRRSKLKIETEDFADISLFYSSGMLTNIHLDYFAYQTQRFIEIFGENIQVKADFIKRKISFFSKDGNNCINFDKIDRDYRYLKELKYFFNCIESLKEPINNIQEHYTILKPLIDFKKKCEKDDHD